MNSPFGSESTEIHVQQVLNEGEGSPSGQGRDLHRPICFPASLLSATLAGKWRVCLQKVSSLVRSISSTSIRQGYTRKDETTPTACDHAPPPSPVRDTRACYSAHTSWPGTTLQFASAGRIRTKRASDSADCSGGMATQRSEQLTVHVYLHHTSRGDDHEGGIECGR